MEIAIIIFTVIITILMILGIIIVIRGFSMLKEDTAIIIDTLPISLGHAKRSADMLELIKKR